MLWLKPELLRLWHWQSDDLTLFFLTSETEFIVVQKTSFAWENLRTYFAIFLHCSSASAFLPLDRSHLEQSQSTGQRYNTENSKQIFPEKQLRGLSPNFHIHVSVLDLYIPRIDLPILLQENMWSCSATAPISYPASLSNFPNGCQGHPRFYPPPDHLPITKPDSNCVRTRCSFLFNYWHGLT